MTPQQKLESLATRCGSDIKLNDRLFYGKYLYRLELMMLQHHVTWYEAREFFAVNYSQFVSTIRRYAASSGDRVRVEDSRYLNYYTSDIETLEKIINYTKRVQAREEEITYQLAAIDAVAITMFPGSELEKNIRYRKTALPHGIYRFQVYGKTMNTGDFANWYGWASQYESKIYVPGPKKSPFLHKYGTWSGESLGYVEDEKTLQLVQFKLGASINKIIEYKIR